MNASAPWIPVAASSLLEPGKVMPVTVAGVEVAVWRTASGRAHAWVDRCPHRGMRLSLGAVAKDSLICPYHGWRFDAAGHCVQMPAHPGTSPGRAARVRRFSVREEEGLVWIGSEGPSDEPQETETATDDDHRDRSPARVEARTSCLAQATDGAHVRSAYLPGNLLHVASLLATHPLIVPEGMTTAPSWGGWKWSMREDDAAAQGEALVCSARLRETPGEATFEAAVSFEARAAAADGGTVEQRAVATCPMVRVRCRIDRHGATTRYDCLLHPSHGGSALLDARRPGDASRERLADTAVHLVADEAACAAFSALRRWLAAGAASPRTMPHEQSLEQPQVQPQGGVRLAMEEAWRRASVPAPHAVPATSIAAEGHLA